MPISETYNIDCLEGMKNYADNYFDLAIVDVPYGIGESKKDFNSRNVLAKQRNGTLMNVKSNRYTQKEWDNEPPTEEYFKELMRVSKNQIIWGANHFINLIPYKSSCWIVWDKDNGANDFADCELAWTSFKTAVRKFKFRWHGMLQENMKNKEERIHPTQKPVKLYEWLLMKYANTGDKILDTHLGSGSSRIASHNLGFDFVGFELDTEYYENEIKRFNQVTSQLAMF